MGHAFAVSGTAQFNWGETHMRSRLTKKRMLSLASVLVIALAGIAYAFYSSTGEGSGTGSAAATDGSTITVTGTAATALTPGNSSAVTFTASNPGNDGAIRSIELTDVDTGVTGCDPAWFTMDDVVIDPAVAVAHDASSQALTGHDGTLEMSNESTSQDDCKNATLSLTFSTH